MSSNLNTNTTPLRPVAATEARLAITGSSAKVLHQEIRRNTAIAAGIEAIAQLAFDDGEATPEQLEHVASLATLLRGDLEQLAAAVAEIAANGRAR